MDLDSRDHLERLERELAELHQQIRGLPVRVADTGGGGGEHFQLIRGTAVGNVTSEDVAFQLENLVALEEHAKLPESPVWVSNVPALELTMGDACYAVFREGALVIPEDPPTPEITVDWEAVPTSAGASTPPLREFELTATKTHAQNTATVKWLDAAGDMVGDDTVIFDPEQRFSGRALDYIEGEPGFRGLALLRRDLAEEPTADFWEIVALERFAEIVVADLYTADPVAWRLEPDAFYGDSWNFRRPAANNGDITISDPASMLPSSLESGMKVTARLVNPDASPPAYAVVSVKATGDTRVREFELVAAKTLGSTTATARFVDFTGAMHGDSVPIYDPEHRFSGRAAGYLGGSERGFRGFAAERDDPANPGTKRWEIVVMEMMSQLVIVQYYTSGVWLFTGSHGGTMWDIRRPTLQGSPLNVEDPGMFFNTLPATGTRAFAVMANPDTSPPTYVLMGGGANSGQQQPNQGAFCTVYIDKDIPKATQDGTSYSPATVVVEKYELNFETGKYQRGEVIEIENHDTALSLKVEGSDRYRGTCSKNEYGRWVVHLIYCSKIESQ